MKKLLMYLFTVIGFFSCSQDEVVDKGFSSEEVPTISTEARDRQKFYTLAYKIPTTWETLTPGPIATDGKILVVGDINPDNYSAALYGVENGASYPRIKSWSHNDSTITIRHAPSAVCIYDGRIYLAIAEEGKVHVFDASSFNFITTIGNGNMEVEKPSDDKFAIGAPCTLVARDGKLLIRSRKHTRLYNTADITPENYEAVPYYAADKASYPIQPGTTLNQGYASAYGGAYLTDADQNRILSTDIFTDIPAGDEVTIIIDEDTFASAPSGVTSSEDRTFASFGTGGVKEYTSTGFRFLQNVTVKDNPLPEVKSIATGLVEYQPVLFIATPSQVWVVWVTPFQKMLMQE